MRFVSIAALCTLRSKAGQHLRPLDRPQDIHAGACHPSRKCRHQQHPRPDSWLANTAQPGLRAVSVEFSRSVVSDSLRPHELQHSRPPCPSPSPRVHSDSRPLSQWCHPAISSSVGPFSSCPQSLPASEFFPMSQLFPWGGQSTGVSALASFWLVWDDSSL